MNSGTGQLGSTVVVPIGDVVGPAGVVADSGIAIYSGTTGKTIKDSVLRIDGSGNVSISGARFIHQLGGAGAGLVLRYLRRVEGTLPSNPT